jgi:hypothetical protein
MLDVTSESKHQVYVDTELKINSVYVDTELKINSRKN